MTAKMKPKERKGQRDSSGSVESGYLEDVTESIKVLKRRRRGETGEHRVNEFPVTKIAWKRNGGGTSMLPVLRS